MEPTQKNECPAARRSVDIAITHGYVVKMDEGRRVFADGAVAIVNKLGVKKDRMRDHGLAIE